MEVGPLARVLMMFATGNTVVQDTVNAVLAELKLPLTALFSTLGRTAARDRNTRRWQTMSVWHARLMSNLAGGDRRIR